MNQDKNQSPPQQQPTYPSYPGYQVDPSLLREEEGIDFKRYIALFVNNWYWFAIALFIALSIAYGINRWSEEVYTVSASLLIQDEENTLSGSEGFILGGDMFKSHRNLQNEIGILKSYSLNYNVMQQLPEFWVTYTGVGRRGIAEVRQYKSTPFKVVFDSIGKQSKYRRIDIELLPDNKYTLKIGDSEGRTLEFGEEYSDYFFKFSILPQNGYVYDNDRSNKYYFWFESFGGLANSYRGKLNVNPIGEEASLITLTTSGYSPEKEADYLNKLMEVYSHRGLEIKNLTAENTINFINEQLGLISDSLTVAENNLENFRLNNELIDLGSEASLLHSRIERYENEKYTIEFEKQYYEYLLEYINSRDESGEIVSPSLVGIADPTVGRLVTELAMLQQEKKQLSFSLKDNLPAVNLMDSQINDVRMILKENVENSLSNVTKLLDDVNGRLAKVEEEIQKLPGTERQLLNIQRKFDLNNTVYNYLMEKRAEAGIARASNVSDTRIIDEAASFNSSRIKPTERKNYLMALVFGLLIPAGLLIIFDLLNNRIIDRRDIEKATDIPLLGFIGHSTAKSEIPVTGNPGSTLAESFRSIRTRIKYFTGEGGSTVMAITSPVSGEGKTFISVNLAAIISTLGKKVLLVGLDLRKPKLHKILGTGNGIGLTSFLIGEKVYEDIFFETEINNLVFTPSGPIPPNPAELIESERMKDFFNRARKEYDYVIIDTPPVAIVTDTLLLASFVDINLFVVRQRYSSKNTIDLINDLRKQGELKNMSIVMNDINLSGYYGYGLRYGNTMGYRGYYYGYNLYGEYGYRRYGYKDKGKDYYTND
ncbi:MAG: polysaccharide biosynthesis tyrosine autokinase [Bacteroidales bacterium]|nr:polysaccharide biosynthesis tyrosine autokinase [Bacteroidales bacterium]